MKIWQKLRYVIKKDYQDPANPYSVVDSLDKYSLKFYYGWSESAARQICSKLNVNYYYAKIEGQMDSDSVKEAIKILRSLSQKI